MTIDTGPESQSRWRVGELSRGVAEVILWGVLRKPESVSALRALARDLGASGSRSVVQLAPFEPTVRSSQDILTCTAAEIAEILSNKSLEELRAAAGQLPFAVYDDVPVDALADPLFSPLPDDAKEQYAHNGPLGYMRMERGPAIHASVGYFDSQTQTHYSLPLWR